MRLQENMAGLNWLVQQLAGKPAGPKPNPHTWKNYWAVEDASEREKLPMYVTIPAASMDEITQANGFPKKETYQTWHRSHGDNGGTRYSALTQA